MGLQKFEFEWTGWFQIGNDIKITLIEEERRKFFIYNINSETFKVELTREIEFINNLEYYHVHEWVEDYTPKDIQILDGDKWSLVLEYDNVKVHSKGHCYYAPTFREMLKIFHDNWDMPYARIEEIDIDEAWEIAKERNPKYNGVEEVEDGWHFFLDDGIKRIGGDTGIVVLKNGTWQLPYEYYFRDAEMPASESLLNEDDED